MIFIIYFLNLHHNEVNINSKYHTNNPHISIFKLLLNFHLISLHEIHFGIPQAKKHNNKSNRPYHLYLKIPCFYSSTLTHGHVALWLISNFLQTSLNYTLFEDSTFRIFKIPHFCSNLQ